MNDGYKYTSLIYDYLMRGIDYSEWAEYLHDLLLEYQNDDAKVLEIAAGTATLSVEMMKFYKNYIVSDLSLNMLKSANKFVTTKVCCDMTLLPFKSKFDIVFSAFDSVNYLLSIEQLEDLFTEVASILNDEGVFTFDLSLERNSLKHARFLNKEGTINNIKFRQESNYNKNKKIHYNKFLIKLADGLEIEELHQQRIYSVDEVLQVANKCGFFMMECLDSFSFEDLHKKSDRAQLVFKKEIESEKILLKGVE